MFKKFKLGTKIISLLIILVLLSVTVVGFMAVKEETSIINGNLTYTTNELSLGLSQKIESYINNNVSVLETLGVTNDIISYNIDGQKHVLKKVNGENKQFALLFVTDTAGQQVSRSDDSDVVNNSDRDYFKEVVSKKKTVISDVLISKATNKPSVVIVVPIFSEQGEFKGVVGGTLDLSNMEEMRSKIKMGETGKAFVTDSKG